MYMYNWYRLLAITKGKRQRHVSTTCNCPVRKYKECVGQPINISLILTTLGAIKKILLNLDRVINIYMILPYGTIKCNFVEILVK